MPLFHVDLGDHGHIGLEYWVLSRPEPSKDPATGRERNRVKPAENFVDASKPVILTHNGQNQGEITGRVIKEAKDGADLPFLQTQGRLICHVNCDRLSPNAKRLLFSSTREQFREGYMLERIRTELIGALKADGELVRLNEEARKQSLKEKDEDVQKQMRRQVAKLLRIAGAATDTTGGGKNDKNGAREANPRRQRAKPMPITLNDPPTFIHVVWEDEEHIPFYAGQRRYVRIETDAHSEYHDALDPIKSRVNIAVGNDLRVFATSPLRGGRMRIGVECLRSVAIGSTGSIRVELYRKGLSTLSDEHDYSIVKPPEPKAQDRQSTLPDFEVIAVPGPEDDDWNNICSSPDDTDVRRHASNSVMNEGKFYVYYSEAFPRFATELRRFEQQGEATAASFRSRYEIWLAVHSLLMHQETEAGHPPDMPEEALDEMTRQERCRLAVIAAMVAAQEVRNDVVSRDEDEALAA